MLKIGQNLLDLFAQTAKTRLDSDRTGSSFFCFNKLIEIFLCVTDGAGRGLNPEPRAPDPPISH